MGRSKKEVFSWLRDRIWKRIDGFGNKFLSKGGKDVLIKSVLQAIPTYVMGCFRLPDYLLKEIDSLIAKFWWGNGTDKKIHWISWKRMCLSKKQGGMGFRDLRSFNQAMLGKQVWRIIQFPDSLLSRILKAKYFPSSDILDAVPKNNSSFTWKSTCGAIDLVKKGIRWCVGSGENISVWGDAWIPRNGAFTPFTPDLYELGDIVVSNLINRELNCWDEQILESIFWEDDITAIMQITITGNHVPDARMWHYSRQGIYTVRSAYFLDMMIRDDNLLNQQGQPSSLQPPNWSWVWKLALPSKVKIFCWRSMHNALPVLTKLQSRGVVQDPACGICESTNESLLHVLKDCHYARMFWAISNLPHIVIYNNCAEIGDWCSHIRKQLSDEEFRFFICGCWIIWHSRNQRTHGNPESSPEEAVAFTHSYITRYTEAQAHLRGPIPQSDNTHKCWNRPPDGHIKLNFDAGISTHDRCAKTAAVARDSDGSVLAWQSSRISHLQNPEVAEALAARLAIKLASANQWRSIILEGDCISVIQALQTETPAFSAIGGVILEIKEMANSFSAIQFNYVNRDCNVLAHLIAKHCEFDIQGWEILPFPQPSVLDL